MQYLTLKIQGQGHENPPKSNQVIYGPGPSVPPKMKETKKLFGSYRLNKSLRPMAAPTYEPVQKHKVNLGMPM